MYPTGCLISEVLQVFKNEFVVRVMVNIDGITRATGIAGAEKVDVAEDRARMRALAVLGIVELAEVKPRVVLDKVDVPVKVLPGGYVPGVDLSDLIAQTTAEVERLGWSVEDGRNYLTRAYGKNSRSMLSEVELRDFLRFLKGQSGDNSYNVI